MTDGTYPRILNGDGCLYGRHLAQELGELKVGYKERMKCMEKKLDRLAWVGIGLIISLATASLTIWINYIGP